VKKVATIVTRAKAVLSSKTSPSKAAKTPRLAPHGALAQQSTTAKTKASRTVTAPIRALNKPKSRAEMATSMSNSTTNQNGAHADETPVTPTKPVRIRSKPGQIVLPADYRPSDNEPFMNEMHRQYFRNKLMSWKDDIIKQNRETLQILLEDNAQHADIADRATSEADRTLELRARDRQRKLISKIDAAIARVDDGSYGYCEDTGEPISLKRLDARPIATLSLEAQERHERRERVYRDDN
jgi:DnaK suppressor protein